MHDDLAHDLARSPAWYPLTVSRERATLVRLAEADYAAASFLDQRILSSHPATHLVSAGALEASAARLQPRAHYLFHVGHVGSTLISRLIGAHPDFFSVREPALLRALASDPKTFPLRSALSLLSRTWRPRQRAIIKATSFVNEIAGQIVLESGAVGAVAPGAALPCAVSNAAGRAGPAALPGVVGGAAAGAAPGAVPPRSLLIFASAAAYLRGILGGPNSRVEAKMLGAARLRRLCRQFPVIDSACIPRAEGEWIAMSWLTEMSALHELAERFPTLTHWVEFDAFLNAPAAGLASMFRALGARLPDGEIEALASGPYLKQYSKAPEYAYDAALRRDVLHAAEMQHGAEISLGMKWLDSVSRVDPKLRAILAVRPAAG